jgi:hypothetical protein
MQEERRPLDPTRRMLRVFGVKMTEYDERAAALLDQAAATAPGDSAARLTLALAALDLTAELHAQLGEMNTYALDRQARLLAELKERLTQ